MTDPGSVTIGIVSVSDRASSGVYEDKGLPALKDWLARALKNPITFQERLIPDEKDRISHRGRAFRALERALGDASGGRRA